MSLIEWAITGMIVIILVALFLPTLSAFSFVVLVAGLLIHFGFGFISVILALKKASGKEVLEERDLKELVWIFIGGVFSYYQYLRFKYKNRKSSVKFKNPFYKE